MIFCTFLLACLICICLKLLCESAIFGMLICNLFFLDVTSASVIGKDATGVGGKGRILSLQHPKSGL